MAVVIQFSINIVLFALDLRSSLAVASTWWSAMSTTNVNTISDAVKYSNLDADKHSNLDG